MNTFRRIGILGGMGPEATILLQQRLIDSVDAADDSDHIPLIIDMNPQVPSRMKRLIDGPGEDPAPVIAAMARRLRDAGAQALAMPCNTAHHYCAAISAAVSVPLLNMVELSADLAARTLGRDGNVGMLASPAVRMTGLFDRALERRGLRPVWPDDEQRLLAAIRLIKAKGRCAPARDILGAASADLARRGATFQLVACSEFSLIADSADAAECRVDTLDVLVNAIREFSLSPNPLEPA